jgi:hypothetical protein
VVEQPGKAIVGRDDFSRIRVASYEAWRPLLGPASVEVARVRGPHRVASCALIVLHDEREVRFELEVRVEEDQVQQGGILVEVITGVAEIGSRDTDGT